MPQHVDPLPHYVQDRITHKHEGFPKVDYRTSLLKGKGPSGALLFSLVGVSMLVGFVLTGYSQNKKAYASLTILHHFIFLFFLLLYYYSPKFARPYYNYNMELTVSNFHNFI
jgi:hypothetical protein